MCSIEVYTLFCTLAHMLTLSYTHAYTFLYPYTHVLPSVYTHTHTLLLTHREPVKKLITDPALQIPHPAFFTK